MKPYFKSRDEVPEWLPQEELVETELNGEAVFMINVEETDGLSLQDVGGLRKALQEERNAHKESRRKAKSFDEFSARMQEKGIEDPESLFDSYEKISNEWKPPKDVTEAVERAKQQVKAQLQKEVDQFQGQIRAAQEREATEYRDQVLGRALEAANFIPEKLQFVKPTVRDKIQVYRDDKGELRHRVVDETGNEVLSRRLGATGSMTADEYALDVLAANDAYKDFIRGPDASGGGTKSDDTPGERFSPNVQVVSRDAPVDLEAIIEGKMVRE